MAERRSTRVRTVAHTDEAIGRMAAEAFIDGFSHFPAELDNSSGDGSQSTAVTLSYTLRDGTNGFCPGTTGTGRGHAEMDAIHTFWVGVCGRDFETFALSVKKLSCTDKPCCVRCSTVLGMFGITPSTPGTKKSSRTMGSTEWGMSREVLSLLEMISGYPETVLAKLATVDASRLSLS